MSPIFSEETASTVISDLIQNNLDKIFKGVTNFGKDTSATLKVKFKVAFTDYLETIVDKYTFTKTILYRQTPVNLYQFYVDIELVNLEETISSKDIENIISRNNKVVIVGTGGTGKSTLMKHLLLNTVKNKKRIPIFIELRDINELEDLKGFDLLNYIYQKLNDFNFNLEKQYFMNAISQGNFVFLFDGYDELNHVYRKIVSKQIMRISDKLSNNSFIISSRPDRNFVTWNNFFEYKMNPLSKGQCIELVTKLEYDIQVKENFIKILDDKFYKKHHTFLSNPLLLTIMLMTYSQSSDIPEKLCIFYEQAFNTLYSHHDATKEGGYKRVFYSNNLAMDTFKDILGSFSIQAHLKQQNQFTDAEINEYLIKSKKMLGIDFDESSFKKDLINSICILYQDGNKYVFTHRSFQEYFVAFFISKAKAELQLKLFNILPKYYLSEIVFDLLFELSRDRLEENFIIPNIIKIMNETGFSNENSKQAYYQLMIKSKTKFIIEKENEYYTTTRDFDDYTLGYGNYNGFIGFVYEKYSKIYPKVDINNSFQISSTKVYNQYFSDIEDKVTLKTDEIITKVEGLDNVIAIAYHFYNNFVFSMNVLPKLQEYSQKKIDSIDDILFNAL